MRCPHCEEAIYLAPSGQPLTEADYRALASRGTDGGTQEQRLLAALKTGPKNTDDLRKLGLYQVSARVWGLRQKGYEISTINYDGISADGYSHARMALYTLVSEPLEPLAPPPRKGRESGKAQEAAKSGAGAANGGEVACQ